MDNYTAPTAEVRAALKRIATAQAKLDKAQAAVRSAAAERREAIVALRALGWGYGRIGEAVGMSKQAVAKTVTGAW